MRLRPAYSVPGAVAVGRRSPHPIGQGAIRVYPFGQRTLQKTVDLVGGCRYHDSPGGFEHPSLQSYFLFQEIRQRSDCKTAAFPVALDQTLGQYPPGRSVALESDPALSIPTSTISDRASPCLLESQGCRLVGTAESVLVRVARLVMR